MKKLLMCLMVLTGCKDITGVEIVHNQEFLVIVEASPNTQWVGKIDTFTVASKPGEDIRWFKVTRPGVCWEFRKIGEVGMLRAYGSTPDFTYGWTLDQNKYPLWGDANTTEPYGVIRGCSPPVAN